jgi:2,5-diketo-D-gluconate reductase B
MQVVESHGAKLPALGFGTMTLKQDLCVDVVSAALQQGYRSLDTAQMYENETWVGEGLRASGISRDEVFVTTKVWRDRLKAGELEKSVEESLAKLKLSVVDLLLVHWPNDAVPLAETMPAMARVKRAGLTRHIGVANFTVAMLDEAVRVCDEPLVTNQIEVHPFLDQTKILAACRRHGISVTAYCPVARGRVAGNAVLERIGKAHGKTIGQVSLRYVVQKGAIPIPRTAKKERLAENLAIFDFALSAPEMAELDRLAKPDGRVVSPPFHPAWDV